MANYCTLTPDLMWIEGRCYRINDSSVDLTLPQENDMYGNESTMEPTYNEEEEGEEADNFEVTMLSNTRYSTSFHVPKDYLGSVIGKKGSVKIRIERDTKTQIKIPRPGQSGDVVIMGPSMATVKTARRRVNMAVWSSRMRQKPTHFISIPMNNEEIKNNFNKFKQLVLEECKDKGIEDSLFIPPMKLHLTVGVMTLMDSEERLVASKLLQSALDEVIRPALSHISHPLKIRMKGLSYMNDDPTQMFVLYALVQDENATPGALQELIDDIAHYFMKKGFMKDEFKSDHVKLHVTLLNSTYRAMYIKKESIPSITMAKREPFDGSRILEKYSDFNFGVMDLTNIYLSQMGTMDSDGYYEATCSVTCTPTS